VPELNIVFLSLKYSCKLFAKIYLFGRRSIVLGYDMRIARNGVDDYGWIV
jgi:hypothetical protein